MSKRSLHFLFASLLLTSYSSLEASHIGQVQLAVASPNPVRAGDTLIFQVVAVNTGSEEWKENDTSFIIEIYTKGGRFLQKSDEHKSTEEVKTGGNIQMFIPMRIQQSYSGDYQFKVTGAVEKMTHRIFTSPFYSFKVVPLDETPKGKKGKVEKDKKKSK